MATTRLIVGEAGGRGAASVTVQAGDGARAVRRPRSLR